MAASHSDIGKIVVFSVGIAEGELPPLKNFKDVDWYMFQLQERSPSGQLLICLPGSVMLFTYGTSGWRTGAVGQTQRTFDTARCIIDNGMEDLTSLKNFFHEYNRAMLV
jgi:hypothetical protein